jgi:outer membrane protein TolC
MSLGAILLFCARTRIVTKLLLLVLLIWPTVEAQQPLTLPQAVVLSLKNYPAIRVSQEQMNASAAGIQLARTAYLPRVDALAQFNRATRNNVFGMLLPQSVVPSMSGPVIGSNNLGSVWGSAVGVLVTWEPFDFGLRSANVSTARAERAVSEAGVKRGSGGSLCRCISHFGSCAGDGASCEGRSNQG